MQITERTLWKYDVGGEGVLTGTFIATLDEIQRVCGEAIDHAEFGMFTVDQDDFQIIASDMSGDEDADFIDAVVSRNAAGGFNPIIWVNCRRMVEDEEFSDSVLDQQHIEEGLDDDFPDTELEEEDVE